MRHQKQAGWTDMSTNVAEFDKGYAQAREGRGMDDPVVDATLAGFTDPQQMRDYFQGREAGLAVVH